MAVVTDFTKVSKDIIVDLINGSQTPASALVGADVTFGSPTVNTTTPETIGNTELVVTGVPASGYKESVTVTYNRVELSVVQATADTVFEIGAAVNVVDLLPQINARFGINLVAGDIVDAALPALTEGPEDFTLTVVAAQLVFVGEMTLQVIPDAVDINTVVTTTVLDGLEWPAG